MRISLTTFNKIKEKTKKLVNKANVKVCLLVSALAGLLNDTAKKLGIEAYCDIDANATVNNFMSTIFNVAMFGGIIFIAIGIALSISTFAKASQGEQVPPNSIAKDIGFLVTGLVLVSLRTLLTTMTGQDPANITLF